MKRSERIHIFVTEIWNWYARHKRELPWRDLQIQDDTQRAYMVLVSEIMLQQTQVPRVKIVFKNFLETFPTVDGLAAATNAEVILAWRGMGYNSRALRLRDCAKCIVKNGIDVDLKQLQKLPGVGHYTAAAIRNFAFNIPTPCIDTNIRRILHRTFIGPENADGSWKKDDAYLLKLAEQVLDIAISHQIPSAKYHLPNTNFDAANWHAALMDFGSLVCTKRNPKWEICPLTKAGIMKAAHKIPSITYQIPSTKKEPGRDMCGKYIPNRIFRGKIIEELRDAPEGLCASDIGERICLDWHDGNHMPWLQEVIAKLKNDHLIEEVQSRLVLAL